MSPLSLTERARRVVPGGVHSGRRNLEPPFCVRRAYGAYLEDVDGVTYIDYQGGAGTAILGHAHPAVAKRVQAAALENVLSGVGTTVAEVNLAERIAAHVPSVEQTLFCCTGSEATFNAIRLARAVTGREKLIKFQGCYHGFHDYVLRNCQSQPERIGTRDPHSAGMLAAAVDSTLVCRYNDLADVRATVEANDATIAAIIVEPIAHNGPGIVPQPGFLEGLRAICDQHGALLIFDEIITGFRHHVGGYQAICGVMPDLTTLGKAIANGFPFAALGGRTEHMERFSTVRGGDVAWAGTYNANGIGVAAALATLDLLADGSVHAHISALGDLMRDGLVELTRDLSVPTSVCGYGSLFSLIFTEGPILNYEDAARNDVDLFVRYRRALIDRGVFEFPDTDGTRSHISAAHTSVDIERTLAIAEGALAAALRRRSRA
ncbi:MAG TPA: aspartate aminotransferase family protein [Solirubrobacteraceae bacterium]|nr:aspartate aminotransferase family protein [Solirubrobacteraceae bacterium]